MPLYDFQCDICLNTFDDITPIDADAPKCPKCGSASKRLIGCPGTLWLCFTDSMTAGVVKPHDKKRWPYKVRDKKTGRWM